MANKLKIGTLTDATLANDYCKIHSRLCQHSNIVLEQSNRTFTFLSCVPAVVYIPAVSHVILPCCSALISVCLNMLICSSMLLGMCAINSVVCNTSL